MLASTSTRRSSRAEAHPPDPRRLAPLPIRDGDKIRTLGSPRAHERGKIASLTSRGAEGPFGARIED